MAAVLACGSGMAGRFDAGVLGQWGAAISHRSAASLWGLLPPGDGPIDVSVPGRGGRRKRRGIRLHRTASLSSVSVTLHNAIPVTTPARAIYDLRGAVSDPRSGVSAFELRGAIRQAEVLGLPIGRETEADGTRSELERLFVRLCRRYRLPTPEVNVAIGGMTVDFLWRRPGVVVETDGYRFHRGRAAFEEDRGRDLRLRALGYEVIRLSYRQVADEPEAVATMLRNVLGSGSGP